MIKMVKRAGPGENIAGRGNFKDMEKDAMCERNGGLDETYKIGELSRLTGVKAGTIRFYEKCGFIRTVERTSGNYRIYRRKHIFQVRVCRLVFGGFVNKRLRRESLKVLEASAGWDLGAYERESVNYLRAVEEDIERTRKAISVCEGHMCQEDDEEIRYSKKQAAAVIGVTSETIRNWERNGLLGLFAPYQRRFYGQALLDRMYVIRMLLDLGYSMMAVRSYVQAYESRGPKAAQKLLLNPPRGGELCYPSDRYLEELIRLRGKALQLREMKSQMESL